MPQFAKSQQFSFPSAIGHVHFWVWAAARISETARSVTEILGVGLIIRNAGGVRLRSCSFIRRGWVASLAASEKAWTSDMNVTRERDWGTSRIADRGDLACALRGFFSRTTR
jgi:hypothetical protein